MLPPSVMVFSGATHEHMRWDRDGFVKILHQNLLPGAERNFDTKSGDAYNTFGTPFDYESVMHRAVLKMTTLSTAPSNLHWVIMGQNLPVLNGLSQKSIAQMSYFGW